MPTAADIAASLDTAPAWAKIGLTMRSERLREDAVQEIARHVHMSLYEAPRASLGQLTLPL